MLGEIDGIMLAAQLLQRDPPVPVVLMTGYAVRLEQAVRQQMDVLPKPCSPAMLAEAIGRALARVRTQRQDQVAQ
jgi:two-component system NtrC family sensor kinase